MLYIYKAVCLTLNDLWKPDHPVPKIVHFFCRHFVSPCYVLCIFHPNSPHLGVFRYHVCLRGTCYIACVSQPWVTPTPALPCHLHKNTSSRWSLSACPLQENSVKAHPPFTVTGPWRWTLIPGWTESSSIPRLDQAEWAPRLPTLPHPHTPHPTPTSRVVHVLDRYITVWACHGLYDL